MRPTPTLDFMTALTAMLSWYDWPEVHHATDDVYQRFRDELPAALAVRFSTTVDRHQAASALWRSAALGLAQACNVNVASDFADVLVPVGAPVFDVATLASELDAPLSFAPGQYQSAVVTGRSRTTSTLAGARLAANAPNSYSGFWSLLREVQQEDPNATIGAHFGAVHFTQSHRQSAALVAEGGADIAAIDVVCLALLRRHSPAIFSRLRVLRWTEPALAPPFVTARSRPEAERETIAAALTAALTSSEGANARAALFLGGVRPVEASELAAIAARIRPSSAAAR